MCRNPTRHRKARNSSQGGPLSPLLANVLLDVLDRELEKRGLHFCRYADDCIIFVRTMEAGERVLVSISLYIIGLEGKLRIAPASVKKLKAKIRKITGRTRPTPLREVISELIPVIRGWTNFYKQAAINKLCQELDEWTRRRLSCLRRKQSKHPKGIRRFLESLGGKRKLWSGIVAMGTRWWRIAARPPRTSL